MKVLVLIAGCIGAVGYFEPFFIDHGERLTASRLLDYDADRLGKANEPVRFYDAKGMPIFDEADLYKQPKQSPVPFFFLSAIVFLIVGFVSIVLGSFNFVLALCSFSAAMLALGGYMHAVNLSRHLAHDGHPAHLAHGATMLLVSGLLGLVASIVALVKREPPKPEPPKPPPQLPEARLIT